MHEVKADSADLAWARARCDARGASPSFSIIIATLDPGESLRECLASIAGQSLSVGDYEVLVVDGGSTDGTLAVLEQVENLPLSWRSQPDRGIFDAWNIGLRAAAGRWILFLGADDRLASRHVLEAARDRLRDRAELVCFGSVALEGGRWDGTSLGDERWRPKFRYRMSVPHQGAFHRREMFDRCGGFDTSFRITGDYELLARPAVRDRICHLDGLEVAVMGQGGISSVRVLDALREAYRVQRLHRMSPLFTSSVAYLFFRLRHQLFRRR